MSRHRRLLRRVVGAAATSLAVGLLAACGSSGFSDDDAGADTAGPWTFTDDLGQRIELDEPPTRIAAYGNAAAALIGFGVEPVALYHYLDPAQDSTFDDIDLTGVEVVGTAYGELDLDALAAADPDLVVTVHYDETAPVPRYGFKDAAQQKQVEAIAPVATVLQKGTALDVVEANERLAKALGADVDGGKVADDKKAFEEASARLTEAAANDVTVAALSADKSAVFFAIPEDDPTLASYQLLGVTFVETGGEEDYYWETVSWADVAKYDADLILYSVRDSWSREQLLKQPAFARLKAAVAEQLHPWDYTPMDYASQAAAMDELAEVIAGSRNLG